jgi:phosphoserine aminotransferase
MSIITFFPGPSQVYPELGQYMQDAFNEGILSISHRSETFNQLSEQTLSLLRKRLAIPDDYTILYTSSATESWEIIAQSLTKKQSVHYSSGSFGDKWFQYAQSLRPGSHKVPLQINEEIKADFMEVWKDDDLICLTQNETSNATQIGFDTLATIRGAFPDRLIALDCTSSMAGIHLPFALGDIWFASVQKCFGLPAGLGILILSPDAVERAKEINDKKHYNSILIMLENIEKFQTSCTPNVLGIYLLNKVLQNSPNIEAVDTLLRTRMKVYESIFEGKDLRPLIQNEKVRSTTVLAVEGDVEMVAGIKAEAKASGILLGAGYGKWKPNTFRIANFPAYTDDQVNILVEFLNSAF